MLWLYYGMSTVDQLPVSHPHTESSLGQVPPLYAQRNQHKTSAHNDANKHDLSKVTANCTMGILGVIKTKYPIFYAYTQQFLNNQVILRLGENVWLSPLCINCLNIN